MIVLKQFVSLTMTVMENGEKPIISVIIVTIPERVKYFIKNMNLNLIHSNYH